MSKFLDWLKERIKHWIKPAVLATSFIRPELSGKRGLSCYFTLIIFWEQQNEQNPSLATRARQTLDKTGYISPNHRCPIRSDTQPCWSGCRKCIASPAIDCVESTDQTTTDDQPWSFSPGCTFPFYEVLETYSTYCSAATLLRWHRELFGMYWRKKSQGKPKITAETIALIEKMAKENRLWGAERIRGELLRLGIEVE